MAFLPQGSSAQVAITAGQSIAVGAVRGGTANVTFPVGYAKGPSDTVVNGTETFGPFATATTVTVYAAQGTAEYVTGTNPVCTDGPVALATDPLTGRTGVVMPDGTIRYFDSLLDGSAVPVAVPSNGTVATNGIVTLATALPNTFTTPIGIWLYLPAGAVSGGSAGFYWVVMSSATVGQVYTKYVAEGAATAFTPYIPTDTLTNAVGSNSAYTQTTATDIRLCNVVMAASEMGVNGKITMSAQFSGNTGAAGARTIKWGLGNNAFGTTQLLQTTFGTGRMLQEIRNRGVANRQVGYSLLVQPGNGSTSAPTYTSEATASAINVYIPVQLATATDCIVMEGFDFTVTAGK